MDATVMFLFVDSRSDFIQNLLLHQNIPETTRLHIYLLVNKVNDNKKKLLYLIWITLHGQQLTISEFIKQCLRLSAMFLRQSQQIACSNVCRYSE